MINELFCLFNGNGDVFEAQSRPSVNLRCDQSGKLPAELCNEGSIHTVPNGGLLESQVGS